MPPRAPAARTAAPRARGPAAGHVTIRDVAAKAGVSLMTVSRAVTQPDRLAADTLQKVQQAMNELGYVPNMAAVSLRSAQSRLVAAIVPTLTTHMFDAMLSELTERLARSGYQVLIGQSQYQPQREVELLRATLSRRPDGILVTGSVQNKEARSLLAAAGIPVVEAGDLVRDHIDMAVGVSHEAMGAQVCRYLVERGRRRLAVLSGNDTRAKRRAAAFRKEAKRLGIADVHIAHAEAPTNLAAGRRLMAELAAQGPAVDGIHCGSDVLAAGVLAECRDRGIDVPAQVAVVGMGDSDLAELLSPSLTSVRVEARRIGELAADMLLARFQQRPLAASVEDVGFTIVTRQSA